MSRCMYPISLVLDSLRNDVRRFHITIDAGTQDTLELVRIGDGVSIAGAKTSKYIKATMARLGLGLLSVAAFLGLVFTDAVTSTESPPQTLSCRYMTVSLARGNSFRELKGHSRLQMFLARRRCSRHHSSAETNVLPGHVRIGEKPNSWLVAKQGLLVMPSRALC
jgi:hypothetical protein